MNAKSPVVARRKRSPLGRREDLDRFQMLRALGGDDLAVQEQLDIVALFELFDEIVRHALQPGRRRARRSVTLRA